MAIACISRETDLKIALSYVTDIIYQTDKELADEIVT